MLHVRVHTSFRATEVADALCASLGLHSDRLGATTRLAPAGGGVAAGAGALSWSVGLSALDGAWGSGGTAVLQDATLQGWACNARDDVPLYRSLILRIMVIP